MSKKRKYPKIEPKYEENESGKKVRVILKYDVYQSIFQRMDDLKKTLQFLKKTLKK